MSNHHPTRVDVEKVARVTRVARGDAETEHVHFESSFDLAQFTHDDYARNKHWTLGSHFSSWPEAQRAIALGAVPDALWEKYHEARARLEPAIEKFSGQGTSTKRKRVRCNDGDELDVDRALRGDAECWVKRRRGAQRKLVRIAVQFGEICAAGEDQFVNAAASATAAADVLTRLGYAVEVVGLAWGHNSTSREREIVVTYTAKQPEQPLDPQAILVAGIPALSRHHEFAVLTAYGHIPSSTYMYNMTDEARVTAGIDYIIGTKWTKIGADEFEFDEVFEGFNDLLNNHN